MMLSSSAAATPSPAGTIASSPAASVMPPTSGGCIGGPSSVHGIQKIQQKQRAAFQVFSVFMYFLIQKYLSIKNQFLIMAVDL